MKGMSQGYLCNLDVPYFSALIKEFYNTLAIGENGLYAVIRKVTIKITEEILGHVLHMSISGLVDIGLEDKDGIVKMIIGENAKYTNGELLAKQLSVEMRLLHSFVTHILFPKIGRFDFISDRDLGIMKYINEQKSVNIPRLMMNYMWDIATKRHSSLPYDMVLT